MCRSNARRAPHSGSQPTTGHQPLDLIGRLCRQGIRSNQSPTAVSVCTPCGAHHDILVVGGSGTACPRQPITDVDNRLVVDTPWDYVTLLGVPLAGEAGTVVANVEAARLTPEWDGDSAMAEGLVVLYAPGGRVENVTLFAPGHAVGEIVRVPGGGTSPPVPRHRVVARQGIDLVTPGDERTAVRQRLHEAITFDPPG
jgi:hypothetical protein